MSCDDASLFTEESLEFKRALPELAAVAERRGCHEEGCGRKN